MMTTFKQRRGHAEVQIPEVANQNSAELMLSSPAIQVSE